MIIIYYSNCADLCHIPTFVPCLGSY